MNKKKLLILGGGAVVLLLIILIAAKRGGSHSATTVRETVVRSSTFETRLPESGVVQRPRLQTVATLVGGNVGSIFVKPGDGVAAGQLLATIENPQLNSTAQSSSSAYMAALAHAQSAAATTNTSIAQARANLESARARLTQAQQDLANGSQSGLGYGGNSAADQRAQSDAALARTSTDLGEARRKFQAYQSLYASKAVSLDQVDQARAALAQAQIAYNQARQQRASLGGQLVRSQQVLRDNLRSAQQNYAEAQAALSAAQTQAGGGDVAAARADAARAASDASFAQQQASRTQIRAPFSGVIQSATSQAGDSLRPLQPGDLVQPGQPLFTLAGSGGFIVRTKVDEQDIGSIRFGQRAVVTGEDFPGKHLDGTVVAIAPQAQKSDDPSSTARQVITTIRLHSAPPFLHDGMSVDVDILTTQLRNVLTLPNDAIVTDQGHKYVFVVRNGVAKRVRVRLGRANDLSSVVVSGVKRNDRVIAERNVLVVDGTVVTAAPSSSPGP